MSASVDMDLPEGVSIVSEAPVPQTPALLGLSPYFFKELTATTTPTEELFQLIDLAYPAPLGCKAVVDYHIDVTPPGQDFATILNIQGGYSVGCEPGCTVSFEILEYGLSGPSRITLMNSNGACGTIIEPTFQVWNLTVTVYCTECDIIPV